MKSAWPDEILLAKAVFEMKKRYSDGGLAEEKKKPAD